jgi:hypothetical protein
MAGLELERQNKLKAIKDKAAAEDRERSAQTTTQLLAFEDVLMKGKSEKQKTAYRLAGKPCQRPRNDRTRLRLCPTHTRRLWAHIRLWRASLSLVQPWVLALRP